MTVDQPVAGIGSAFELDLDEETEAFRQDVRAFLRDALPDAVRGYLDRITARLAFRRADERQRREAAAQGVAVTSVAEAGLP